MAYILFCLFIQPLLAEVHLWNKFYLTYSVENDSFNSNLVNDAIIHWEILPTLEFKEVPQGQGDIKIYFKPLLNSVGMGFYPEIGIIFINSNVTHKNLTPIIQHEFGHALGLAHSDRYMSIMNPHLTHKMRILKSDKQNLNELYKCRYESVTLLNGYTYLKFRGRYYERFDFNSEYISSGTVWQSITKVSSMYRNNSNYFILSDNKYFMFNYSMRFEKEGFITELFPHISRNISAVLTLKNGSMIVFLQNKHIWYNNFESYQNLFQVFPDTPIQGAYSDFNHIYLISKENMFMYTERFEFLKKTRLCDDLLLRKVHCCNKYSTI